jgi:hypothetical protein
MMEELHTDSIDGGHEANYGLGHVPGRGRTPTNHVVPTLSCTDATLPVTETLYLHGAFAIMSFNFPFHASMNSIDMGNAGTIQKKCGNPTHSPRSASTPCLMHSS